MLLEYSCSNFKSIKDKISFSFMASNDDTNGGGLLEVGGHKFFRTSVVYGANGSGKSNFLSSITFMKNMVVNSMNHQPGDLVAQWPHKLSNDSIPTEFYIQFIKDDVRYVYAFSILHNLIDEEYLYSFPLGRQVKVFERKGMQILPGDKFKTSFKLTNEVLKENRLFLSCSANYSKCEECENAFKFFKEDIVVYDTNIEEMNFYSARAIKDNETNKKIFINLLRNMDIPVKDILVKIEKRSIPTQIPEVFKQLIPSETNYVEVKMVYDEFTTDLYAEESQGIRKVFEMLGPIIDIITNGKIFICDELENCLHEQVIAFVISLFENEVKEKKSQLLFSTHDTSLLDSKLFRRDQIWFTELKQDRSTDLYSLSEIKNVRKGENLKNGYLQGKYGAIPTLNYDGVGKFFN